MEAWPSLTGQCFIPYDETFSSVLDMFLVTFGSSFLLDDDAKQAEQHVVGPSFALADVYCPFQDGAERSEMNQN